MIKGTTVKIPDEFAADLRKLSSKRQLKTAEFCSVASIVKEAIAEYLKNHKE